MVGDVERDAELGPTLGRRVTRPRPRRQQTDPGQADTDPPHIVVGDVEAEQHQPHPAGDDRPHAHCHPGSGVEGGVQRAPATTTAPAR